MLTSTSFAPRKSVLAAAALLMSVSLLAGCGGGAGDDGARGTDGKSDVASLDKGEKGEKSAPGSKGDKDGKGATKEPKSPEEANRAAADSGRPQRRLDTSDEEETRMWNTYFSCLKENGVKMDTGGPSVSGGAVERPAEGPAEPKAAYAKCLVKMPLMAPEMDPERNPRYRDDFTEWVRCINSKGVPVKALADGSGWNYTGTPKMPPAKYHKIENDCKLEAFRDKG
ncbi:hypothetical protein [Streptomyces sp. NPDC054863]